MHSLVGVSAAKSSMPRMRILPSLRCATVRTAKSRREQLSRSLVGIPKSTISIQGKLKTFRDIGDSGQAVERNFCPECGSPIITDVAVMPELTFIKAGTLDDTSWLVPNIHMYCDSAQRWSLIPEDCQKFAKMPT